MPDLRIVPRDTVHPVVVPTPYRAREKLRLGTSMGMQITQNKLIPFNCVGILIDFQKRLLSTIDSTDVKTLIEKAFDLTWILDSFGIPTILTTIGARRFGGPLLPQLQMIFF